MTALDRLDAALIALASDNRQTPCQGSRRARWTSDDHGEREWAAWHCRSLACPVLDLCAAAADELKASAGVWGGTLRGPSAQTGRPKTPRTTNQKAS